MRTSSRKIYKSKYADVTVDWFDEGGINNVFGENSKTQQKWTVYLRGEINEYVPAETRMMAMSAYLHSTNTEIVYVGPQVRRLYKNPQYKFSTAVHAKAGAYWDLRAQNDRQEIWNAFYTKLIAKEF